jgi:HK97 family phage major capsid protein
MPLTLTKTELENLIANAARKQIEKLARTAHPEKDRNITQGTDEGEQNFRELKESSKLYEPIQADGFASFQDFLKTMAFSPGDSRLTRVKMESGDPEQGGYLIPVLYHDNLFRIALEKSVLLDKVSRAPMKTAEEKFPRVIDTDHSGGELYGGIRFRWISEGDSKQESEPKLGQLELKARTACSLCKVTTQLLEDSKPSAEKALKILFTDALSWCLDDAIIRGSGAGMPKGILGSGALITQTKEGGQGADTILFKNCKKMFMHMHPALRDEAVWLISPSAIEQILDMSMTVGAGGGPVVIAYGGGVAPIPDKLLGRPLIFTEHAEALGDLGDILFVHPKSYLLGVRKEMVIDASIHVHFTTNEVLFRYEWRGDGQPILNEKLTIRSGGSFEVSPFITLEERT